MYIHKVIWFTISLMLVFYNAQGVATDNQAIDEDSLLQSYDNCVSQYEKHFNLVGDSGDLESVNSNIFSMNRVLDLYGRGVCKNNRTAENYAIAAVTRLIGYYAHVGDSKAALSLLEKHLIVSENDNVAWYRQALDRSAQFIETGSQSSPFENKIRHNFEDALKLPWKRAVDTYIDIEKSINRDGSNKSKQYNFVLHQAVRRHIGLLELMSMPYPAGYHPKDTQLFSEIIKGSEKQLKQRLDLVFKQALSNSRLLGLPITYVSFEKILASQEESKSDTKNLSFRHTAGIKLNRFPSMLQGKFDIAYLNNETKPGYGSAWTARMSAEQRMLILMLYANNKQDRFKYFMAMHRYSLVKFVHGLDKVWQENNLELGDYEAKMQAFFYQILHGQDYRAETPTDIIIDAIVRNTLSSSSLSVSEIRQQIKEDRIDKLRMEDFLHYLESIEQYAEKASSSGKNNNLYNTLSHFRQMATVAKLLVSDNSKEAREMWGRHSKTYRSSDYPVHQFARRLVSQLFYNKSYDDEQLVVELKRSLLVYFGGQALKGVPTSRALPAYADATLLYLVKQNRHSEAIALLEWIRSSQYKQLFKKIDDLKRQQEKPLFQPQLSGLLSAWKNNQLNLYVKNVQDINETIENTSSIPLEEMFRENDASLHDVNIDEILDKHQDTTFVYSYLSRYGLMFWSCQKPSKCSFKLLSQTELKNLLNDSLLNDAMETLLNSFQDAFEIFTSPQKELTTPKSLRNRMRRDFILVSNHSSSGGHRYREGQQSINNNALVKIYSHLFGGKGSFPDNTTKIVIVPDGILKLIPFAALRKGNRYLVELVDSIEHTSSLSEYDRRKKERRYENIGIYSVGNIDGLSALEVEDEARKIKSALPSNIRFKHYRDTDSGRSVASASVFITSLNHDDIVHFSGHGFHGVEGEFESFLVLENRAVGILELLSGDSGSRGALINIASCDSALPQYRQNVINLSLGNLLSRHYGADLVGSLWRADNRYASLFTKQFYRNLFSSNISAATALARAQRHVLNKIPVSGWANFVVLAH